MAGEDFRAAVFADQERVVGFDLVAHFHARRADGHAGHGEAYYVGVFCKQAADVGGGDVAFDHIAVDHRSVAGGRVVGDSEFRL